LKTVRVIVHLYNTHCICIVINFLRSGSPSELQNDIFAISCLPQSILLHHNL